MSEDRNIFCVCGWYNNMKNQIHYIHLIENNLAKYMNIYYSPSYGLNCKSFILKNNFILKISINAIFTPTKKERIILTISSKFRFKMTHKLLINRKKQIIQ